MLNTTDPKCPICTFATDGDVRDMGRAMYFKCERGHEFVVRTDVMERLVDLPGVERIAIGEEACARDDDRILMISNDQGRLYMELVDRSSWLP